MLMFVLTAKSKEKDFPIGVQKGKQKNGVVTSRELKGRENGASDLTTYIPTPHE
jgi:hypothetical protein